MDFMIYLAIAIFLGIAVAASKGKLGKKKQDEDGK